MNKLAKTIIKAMFLKTNYTIRNKDIVNKGVQILLAENYRNLLRNKYTMPTFDEVEFRNYSQNGEDGILLYIFSIIGVSNKKSLEICAGDGKQCNTANLILNHDWNAWLFEGDINNVKRGRKYFKEHPATVNLQPKFINEWVTRENVNDLILANGLEGEVDLLSIDIDGVDYWVLEAIECVSPRVIVLEYQCIWGAERSVTVPYDPNFKAGFIGQYGIYSGASLVAFIKLLKNKRYRLVGCEHNGFNAFFIRDGIADEIFPEIEPSKCVEKPFVKFAQREFFDKIKDLEWTEV